MREPDGYRNNLERVDQAFDHELLTAAEIGRWLGCKAETVKRNFRFNERTGRISKSDLARQISAGG